MTLSADKPTVKTFETELLKACIPVTEDLYIAYCGQIEKLTTASKIAALTDLRSLPIIPDLSQKTFKAYIGTLLLQKPIIQKVDSFVKTPQRFGAVKNLLNSLSCSETNSFNAERAWQTLMR